MVQPGATQETDKGATVCLLTAGRRRLISLEPVYIKASSLPVQNSLLTLALC